MAINEKTVSRVMAELAHKRAASLTRKRRREIARIAAAASAKARRKRVDAKKKSDNHCAVGAKFLSDEFKSAMGAILDR